MFLPVVTLAGFGWGNFSQGLIAAEQHGRHLLLALVFEPAALGVMNFAQIFELFGGGMGRKQQPRLADCCPEGSLYPPHLPLPHLPFFIFLLAIFNHLLG